MEPTAPVPARRNTDSAATSSPTAPSRPGRISRFRLVVGAAITALLTVALLAPASPANADTWTHYVTGTGGDGLWVHSAPELSADSVTELLPEGAELSVDCFVYSDVVGGTDPAWLHITYPVDGWVSDYYVDTWWDRYNTPRRRGAPRMRKRAGVRRQRVHGLRPKRSRRLGPGER